MPEKTKASAQSSRSKKSSPAQHPTKPHSPARKRAIPAKFVTKAKEAFKNFSLSKFAGKEMPSNHVVTGDSPAEAQRLMISQYLDALNNADVSTPVRAMTIALPAASIKQLLPSFDVETRTIDLGEVMNLIQQNMRGTQFYANGNPTLNRLAIQSQVQQIIANVKRDAQK